MGAECNVIMTLEFVYISLVIDKAMKLWHTCLRLRACIEANDDHFEHKL